MKSSNFFRFIFILVCIYAVATLGVSSTYAQIPQSIDGLEVTMTPEAPQSGDSVTIILKSYNTDLNAASFVWYVNDKIVSSEVGKTSITVTAPANGKTLTVSATIQTAEKRTIKKTFTIKPNDIDLVWETNGYAPPFYKGKPYIAHQNTIRIIAIPHFVGKNGVEINPKTLIYQWKKNSTSLQAESGYGKQTVSIVDGVVPRPFTISVVVSARDGSLEGQRQVTIEATEPSLSLYVDDPLYGAMYNNEVSSTLRIRNREVTLLAVPFGFNTSDQSATTYAWSINGQERPELSTNRSVTLRTKDDSTGNSNISLDVRNAASIFQAARADLTAYFNNQK